MEPSIPGSSQVWKSSAFVYVTEKMADIHSLKCFVSFSFVVPLSFSANHCYLYHLLSFVVSQFTTHLPFYKRSQCLAKIYYYLRQEVVVALVRTIYTQIFLIKTFCFLNQLNRSLWFTLILVSRKLGNVLK